MGQSRNVMVHRLIALDSIDEDLVRLISEKQAIFDAYAQHSAIKDHSEMSMDSAAVQHDLTEELRRRDEERRRNREKAPPPEVSEWSNEDGARTH
jgi:SNF2 family DNA or RNA helicase